jgi:hypothetical protein
MVDFGLPPPRPYRGQQMRTRDWYVQRYLGSGQKILRSEDSSAVYTSPVHVPPGNQGFTTSILLTMVCYSQSGGCGRGSIQTSGGTWSRVTVRD